MPVLIKEVFRPGLYEKDGQRIIVTDDDVSAAYKSLGDLAKNSLDVPLILEHIPPSIGQREGVPLTFSDLAEELRNTVGRALADHPRTRINEDGGLDVAFDFVDDEIRRKVEAGAIKFVSPELRDSWTDGRGNKYSRLMTHIALTHRPIQTDQRPTFRPLAGSFTADQMETFGRLALSANSPVYFVRETMVRQFAESDRPEQDQTADAGETSGGGDPTPTAPDMPNAGGASDQRFAALIAHLKEQGIELPSDTDSTNLVDRLLTALMTKNAVESRAEAAEAAEPEEPIGGIEEMEPQQAQFSSGSPRQKLLNRIRACKAAKQMPDDVADGLLLRLGTAQFSGGREKVSGGGMPISDVVAMFERNESRQFSDGSPQQQMAARIKRLAAERKITPGMRDQLTARIGSLQFSDGRETAAAGGVRMTDLLEMYDRQAAMFESLTSDQSAGYGQFSGAAEVSHPAGHSWETGNQRIEAGDQRAISVAQGLLQRTGYRRRPTVADVEHAKQFPTAGRVS